MYPTRKQMVKMMLESCLFRSIETVFDAFTGHRHPDWILKPETEAYLESVVLGNTQKGLDREKACREALLDIGCIPWLGKVKMKRGSCDGKKTIPTPRKHSDDSNYVPPRRRGFPVISMRSKWTSARALIYLWFVGPLDKRKVVRTRCGEQGCVNPTHLYLTRSRGIQKAKDVVIDSSMDRMVRALRARVLFGELGTKEKNKDPGSASAGPFRRCTIVEQTEQPLDGDENSMYTDSTVKILRVHKPHRQVIEDPVMVELNCMSTNRPNRKTRKRKMAISRGDASDDEFDANEWLNRLKDYDYVVQKEWDSSGAEEEEELDVEFPALQQVF